MDETNKEQTDMKEQAEKRKFETITKEQQADLNKKNEHKTGLIIRLIRVVRDNPDLIVLGIMVLAFLVAGYWLAKIKLGLTTDQIKVEIWDFIEFVSIVFVGLSALIGKLFMNQGTITKSLSGSASKDADASGRTIVK
jgi:hypothetical protein